MVQFPDRLYTVFMESVISNTARLYEMIVSWMLHVQVQSRSYVDMVVGCWSKNPYNTQPPRLVQIHFTPNTSCFAVSMRSVPKRGI